MKHHPCKLCLVKACCKRNCVDYETYRKAFEDSLYGFGVLFSLIFHISFIILLAKFASYPKTGLCFYLLGFYGMMVITILKSTDEYHIKGSLEKFVIWAFAPIWLMSVVIFIVFERTGVERYPQKHNPNCLI